MRKRRAIIIDDEPLVRNMLKSFFSLWGYEVFSFAEPTVCPILMNNDWHCQNEKPCADVMISDFRMPGMTGLELLERQKEKGCGLDMRNKAIISGFLDGWEEKVEQLGCAFFQKPCRLEELRKWIDACEERMSLSVPLATPRRERRKSVQIDIMYSLPSQERVLSGVVTDISNSGFCLTTSHDLSQKDRIMVKTDLPISCREATVRWTKKLDGESYMAGFNCCLNAMAGQQGSVS